MTDDLVPEFIDDEGDNEQPPVAFKITYTRAGEKISEEFAAVPPSQFPYAWLLDYFAAGNGDATAQAAATVQFLDRVLLANDGPKGGIEGSSSARFNALVHDATVALKGKTLQAVQMFLTQRYNALDPTRARSAGPARSRSGPSSNGTGSTARRSAKAKTSR